MTVYVSLSCVWMLTRNIIRQTACYRSDLRSAAAASRAKCATAFSPITPGSVRGSNPVIGMHWVALCYTHLVNHDTRSLRIPRLLV
jgi:hypothetical protein